MAGRRRSTLCAPLRSPILDAVATLNAHGIEASSGVILGLDTDTPSTYERVCRFIAASRIPLLTINLLQALPHTPLWRRLNAEGRVLTTPSPGESNVKFLLPKEVVEDGWRQVTGHAYRPRNVYGRYLHQMRATYPHRLPAPRTSPRYRRAAVLRGIRTTAAVLWRCGVRAPYRADFWRMVTAALRHGDIEGMLRTAISSHHLITFSREALAGCGEKSFYARETTRPRGPAPARAKASP